MAESTEPASHMEALAADWGRRQEFSLELEEIWLRDQFTGNADGPPGLSMRRTVEAQGRLPTSPAGCCAVTTPLPAPPDESDRNLSAPLHQAVAEFMSEVRASIRRWEAAAVGAVIAAGFVLALTHHW